MDKRIPNNYKGTITHQTHDYCQTLILSSHQPLPDKDASWAAKMFSVNAFLNFREQSSCFAVMC